MDETMLFAIVVLILSVVIHEVSHGYAANWLGDPTARLAGRLTLNPLPHIDPLGSIIIPGILLLTPAPFLVGWAKPVPYNPYNLRDQKWGEAIVAGAGPAVNLFIALIFSLMIRFGVEFGPQTTSAFLPMTGAVSAFTALAVIIVFINILLALFNLIPIPPLDGSKILKAVLPHNLAYSYQQFEQVMMQYGLIAIFLLLILFINILGPLLISGVLAVFSLFTGIPMG